MRSCHDPRRGYTDQSPVSVGIGGQKGGISAPTVLNTGYNAFQFWDGRARSLEDQAQGPVGNAIEMFDGKGHAWYKSIARVREKGDYTSRFKKAFGTLPTRDAIAKAIATYERTVLSGDALVDRAEFAARVRASEEGGDFNPKAEDFALVLKAALKKQDQALKLLNVDVAKDLDAVAAKPGDAAGRCSSARRAARPATPARTTPTTASTTWAWVSARTARFRRTPRAASPRCRPAPRTSR